MEGMKKILYEHNIRQECIDLLNITGSEFLRINPNDLAEIMNLNQSETEMVFIFSNVAIDCVLGGTDPTCLWNDD